MKKRVSKEVMEAIDNYVMAVCKLSTAVREDKELCKALYYPKLGETDVKDEYEWGEFMHTSYKCGYPPVEVIFNYIRDNGYDKEDVGIVHGRFMTLWY